MNQSANDRIAFERKRWEAHQRALEAARLRLAKEGVFYPIWNSNVTYAQFYEKFRDYSAKESAYILEALHEENGKKTFIDERQNWTPYNE